MLWLLRWEHLSSQNKTHSCLSLFLLWPCKKCTPCKLIFLICCKINKDSFCVLLMFCLCFFVMLVHLTICCKINKDSFCILLKFCFCNVSSQLLTITYVLLMYVCNFITICCKINQDSFWESYVLLLFVCNICSLDKML